MQFAAGVVFWACREVPCKLRPGTRDTVLTEGTWRRETALSNAVTLSTTVQRT